MKAITARLDDRAVREFAHILKESRSKTIRDLVEAGRKHLSVELYRGRQVSLGLGARLAGVTLSEFIDVLKGHNVYLNLQASDVSASLKTARRRL